MKKYLLPFALFPLLMISCSKELSLDNGETPQITSDLLVKVVYNYGDDSSQVEYTYNAAKQLIGQRYSGMVQGVTIESESRFIRDAAGLALVPFYAFGASASSPWYRMSIGTCKKEEIPAMLQQLKTALQQLS